MLLFVAVGSDSHPRGGGNGMGENTAGTSEQASYAERPFRRNRASSYHGLTPDAMVMPAWLRRAAGGNTPTADAGMARGREWSTHRNACQWDGVFCGRREAAVCPPCAVIEITQRLV